MQLEQVNSSLVTRFPELVDMLGETVPSPASDQSLPASAHNPHSHCAGNKTGRKKLADPVVIYRDGPFHLVPATLSQPLRIEFGDADREFGLACIVESMRGGHDPSYADAESAGLYKFAARVAQSDANVMITGETGTGKEGMAQYIHKHSDRSKEQFVAINCAAISESMIESILFGHKKGAFTGAYSNATGLFKEADGGTIFLDEITEMPLESQSKLLRVLQEKEILPVGATRPEKVDVRVICAANRNFEQEVSDGKFREDLYWRLNVMPLELKPLRERPADIVAISAFMMMDLQKGAQNFRPLSSDALEQLKNHSWPGNVRELRNVLQRALVLAEGDRIEPTDLMFTGASLAEKKIDVAPTEAPATKTPRQDNPEPGSASRFITGRDLHSIARNVEYEAITRTLEKTNGNRRAAAKELGISERTLRYRMADMRALAEA